MLGIYLMFYHVNPEYFMLPYFALLAGFTFSHISWKQFMQYGLLLSCAWVHNIAYALCVSKKFLSCGSAVYPYGSLIVANVAVAIAAALLAVRAWRNRAKANGTYLSA